ncbi:HAMP domain-containing sensor histidine kinase [Phytoactinopolyspora mesophila]|uniref:Signal transduction histidine-protein kinase/phosphatase MprB n=1 Tax=Phytoactinopolyspora mesophila TaxID=2650750 RepID=A0A7K3MBG2_9ACTN|nr:HAMP domain-containing sensor histidine kinase [Phytoactinopolyspora mesophila]NDL60633.1 HAMP domain-containing protein [Phytoactinopolyspora mesophila]
MLRRLLIVLIPLAILLAGALGVPLATTVAQGETQDMYVDRLNDVGRFASLAETALSTGRVEALQMELERYGELYQTPVALLDPGGEVVLSSDSGASPPWVGTPEVQGVLIQALAGYRPEPPTVLWPWSDGPLVLAEPVGRDSEVVGVIVTVWSIDGLGATVLSRWGRLALLGVIPTVLLLAVAWPVSRWVLRPVRELDEATAAIADGDLSARANVSDGPPELRRLAVSFNSMIEAVERSAHRQRAFVSDASHQLRNPLTSLRLAVENLRPFLRGDAALDAHSIAIDEAKGMNRMLNALLAATRLESFRRAEPVELDLVLETRVERWRALADSAGLDIQIEVPTGMVLLEPPGGLGSVLDELVSNALRLSDGSTVHMSATAAEVVELRVSDDGTGLDPEERAAALGRFWRAPKHQNTVGTGLGLAICAELVEAAGGELRLEAGMHNDSGGAGLAVVVRLPAVPHDH